MRDACIFAFGLCTVIAVILFVVARDFSASGDFTIAAVLALNSLREHR